MIDDRFETAAQAVGLPYQLTAERSRRYCACWSAGVHGLTTISEQHGANYTCMTEPRAERMGTASVQLTQDMTRAAMVERCRQAGEAATFTSRRAYDLVAPTSQPSAMAIEICDRRSCANPEQAVTAVLERVVAAFANCRELSLASAEVNFTHRNSVTTNSRHLRCEREDTSWVLYLITLTQRTEGPFDGRLELNRRRATDLELTKLVNEWEARERGPRRSRLPRSGSTAVHLPSRYLRALLQPLVHHASAETQLHGLSRFVPGTAIAPRAPQWLTVALDATVPFGSCSYQFDGNGVPAQQVTIIEAGQYCRPWCTQTHARSLAMAATGEAGNLRIPRPPTGIGHDDIEDFPEHTLFVDELSNLDVLPSSGHFAGEIRSGRVRDDGTVQRIRGGAISGNLFECLPNLTPCTGYELCGDYWGPTAFVVEGVRVAGA